MKKFRAEIEEIHIETMIQKRKKNSANEPWPLLEIFCGGLGERRQFQAHQENFKMASEGVKGVFTHSPESHEKFATKTPTIRYSFPNF